MASTYYQNLIRRVLDSSVSNIWDEAVSEWYIADCEEDETLDASCICGKENLRYLFTIRNLDIDPTQCHPNYTADIREGVAVEYVSCEPSEGMKELFPEQYGVGDDSFEEEETEQA